VVRYRREASILVGLVVVLWASKWYLESQKAYKERITKLVRQSLLQLSTQQKLADDDTAGKTVRYIAVSSLRDSILPGVKSTDKVWNDVTSDVEGHANVRSRNTEIHGEIMKIWEWIGGEVN
jgi:Man1-Src1p-C-terminal domain